MLCSNRPEGFSTKSIYSSLPTTCFTDTIFLPIPTFILLIGLAILTIYTFTSKSHSSRLRIDSVGISPLQEKKKWYSIFGSRDLLQRPLLYKILIGFYYLFVIANALLAILEIARLSTIRYGIALLPFPVVGVVIAGVLHFTRGAGVVSHWQGLNIVFWLLSMVFSVVKTIGLVLDEGVEGRKGSMYPVEDQVTDTGVMAGLYLMLVVIESGLWLWKGRLTKRGGGEGVKEGSSTSLAHV